jgi:hypothetical protein
VDSNIEESAFDSCDNLETIVVRSPVNCGKVFTNSPNVTSATFALNTLDESVATSFPKLSKLHLEGNCTVKEEAFKGFGNALSLSTYYINTFEKSAFEGCEFKSFSTEQDEIGEATFKDCVFDDHMWIESNSNIGKYAFAGSQFKKSLMVYNCTVANYAFSQISLSGYEFYMNGGSWGDYVFANADIPCLRVSSPEPLLSENTFTDFDTTNCILFLGNDNYRVSEWNGLQWEK